MKIYVLVEEQEQGPFTKSEIFALMKEGTLNSESLARWENETDWKLINDVLASGSFGLFSIEQINKQQTETPSAPLVIPDFVPARPTKNVEVAPKNRKVIYTLVGAVSLGACVVTFFVIPKGPESKSIKSELPLALPVAKPAPSSVVQSTPMPSISSSLSEHVKEMAAVESQKFLTNISSPPKHSPPEPQPSAVRVTTKPKIDSLSTPAPQITVPQKVRTAQVATVTPEVIHSTTTKKPALLSSLINRDNFFIIGNITSLSRAPRSGVGTYIRVPDGSKAGRREFAPSLEVKLRSQKDIQGNATYARIYFFDRDGKKLAGPSEPHPVTRGERYSYRMPSLLKQKEWSSIFFVIPKNLLNTSGWRAVVVFGDKHSASAKVYPEGRYSDFQFAERAIVESPKHIERKQAIDPLVEHVVKTRNPKQPQITLFLRPPLGMTDASDSNGVLALCALGNNVMDLKRRLQNMTPNDDLGWIFRFAEKHKLIILCWGSAPLWDPTRNWDELSGAEQREFNKTFDPIANAWAQGVNELAKKYGIPNKGFFLSGTSGAAQYAMRLALRQPQFFQAVHLHIPSSFDRPTPEASRILWCLTTGELESGHDRSLKFYNQCRELGYPIVYKAIIGLRHYGSPYADRIGEAFFEWALSQREQREELDERLMARPSIAKEKWSSQPWPAIYRNPPFVGDILNQEIFPWQERDMVPEKLRVLLVNKQIADAWNAQKR